MKYCEKYRVNFMRLPSHKGILGREIAVTPDRLAVKAEIVEVYFVDNWTSKSA